MSDLPLRRKVGDSSSESIVALLVEDDAADAELMTLRLESSSDATGVRSLHVLRRESVEGAVALLRQTEVDVIVLDLTLPDARGLEGLHRVRAVSPSTPVIVCAGVAHQMLALDALRAGAQDHLPKPPDGASISRIIRNIRERHLLREALDASRREVALAGRQWKMLAEIGEALRERDLDIALGRVAAIVVPEAADALVLYLGRRRKSSVAARRWYLHGTFARPLRGALSDLFRSHGLDALDSSLFKDGLRAGLSSCDLSTGAAVPVHVGGRVRGLLVLASVASRTDASTAEAFAKAVADRIELALDQTRLLQRTHRAVSGRDRAVSIVSHDLRNPLNAIEICANALLDPEPPSTSGVRQMGKLIHQSAAWMRQIVDELLDRATLDAGRLRLHKRPTDVREIISATEAMFSSMAEKGGIDFVLASGPHLPAVDADPHRLMQALANLVGNAMKFTPRGGRVELRAGEAELEPSDTVTVGAPPPMVAFAVIDTGLGIPADDLPHVFDWFWHSPRDTRSGIGLGLAIAKGIVDAHKGRLRVESALGRGSTFSFTIPVAKARAEERRLAGVSIS